MKLVGETVGQRILAAMQHAGLKKAHLAERTGKSWQAVHAWCTDESVPKAENLRRISDVTGVSMRWIEANEGPPILDREAADSPPGYHEFVEHFGHLFDEDLVESLAGDAFGRYGIRPEDVSAKAYLELAQVLERARGRS